MEVVYEAADSSTINVSAASEIIGSLKSSINSFSSNVPLTSNTSTEGFNAIMDAGFESSCFGEYDRNVESIINSLLSLASGLAAYIESSVGVDESIEEEIPEESETSDDSSSDGSQTPTGDEEAKDVTDSELNADDINGDETEKQELDDTHEEEKEELDDVSKDDTEKQNVKSPGGSGNKKNLNDVTSDDTQSVNYDGLLSNELQKMSIQTLKTVVSELKQIAENNNIKFSDIFNLSGKSLKNVLLSISLDNNIKSYIMNADSDTIQKFGNRLYNSFKSNNLLN